MEPVVSDADKLRCLIAHIENDAYDLVSECQTYHTAVENLERLYVKPYNVIFARHLLMTCRQQPEQSLDDYLQKLKQLSTDCNYRAVTANICRNEAIRDAFISDLISNDIRFRLLENTLEDSLILQAIFDQARSLDIAHKSFERCNALPIASEKFDSNSISNRVSAIQKKRVKLANDESEENPNKTWNSCSTQQLQKTCSYCGNDIHVRSQSSAKRSKCYKCGNYGHFAKQFRSRNKQLNCTTTLGVATLNAENGAPHKANVQITVNGVQANALFDTGPTLSHINRTLALLHNFTQCN